MWKCDIWSVLYGCKLNVLEFWTVGADGLSAVIYSDLYSLGEKTLCLISVHLVCIHFIPVFLNKKRSSFCHRMRNTIQLSERAAGVTSANHHQVTGQPVSLPTDSFITEESVDSYSHTLYSFIAHETLLQSLLSFKVTLWWRLAWNVTTDETKQEVTVCLPSLSFQR